MVIQTPDGLNRPYTDHQGRIWVKSGADKRHVTAREEMQRLFQQAGLIYADEKLSGKKLRCYAGFQFLTGPGSREIGLF